MKKIVRSVRILAFSCLLVLLPLIPESSRSLALAKGPLSESAGPTIRDVSDNLVTYSNGQVPAYQKLEITFQVDTQAANAQFPYDPNPPAGLQPQTGISVDGLFSPDNWHTVYTQPGFYYQDFLDQVKSGQEWFYPTGTFSWKVRFSPDKPGEWQYKLRAQDSSGTSESPVSSFNVRPATGRGPIRVSARDPRYFEHQDGAYFPGLGYNMNFNHVSWINPILDKEKNINIMEQNGIQLVRIWLSEWAIFGSGWNPWQSIDPDLHAQYIPYSGLTFSQSYGNSDVSMEVDASYNPCMFLGFMQPSPAVKRNTNYRVRIRYRISGLAGQGWLAILTVWSPKREAGCGGAVKTATTRVPVRPLRPISPRTRPAGRFCRAV